MAAADKGAELFEAIRNTDIAAIRAWAAQHSSSLLCAATNRHGQLPILAAVETADEAVLEALLDAGADVDGKNFAMDGQTALLAAVWSADDVSVQTLVRRGANPNVQDANRRNALHALATNGNMPLLDYLLHPDDEHAVKFDVGAAIRLQDADGMTPLHRLCVEAPLAEPQRNMLRMLVQQFPDACRTAAACADHEGRTAVHYIAASSATDSDVAAVADLVDPIAEPCIAIADQEGYNVPMLALSAGNLSVLTKWGTKPLLSKHVGKSKATATHVAAAIDNSELCASAFKYLEQIGIELDWTSPDSKNRTAAHIAFKSKNTQAVEPFGGATFSNKPSAAASDAPEDKRATAGGDYSGAGTGKIPQKKPAASTAATTAAAAAPGSAAAAVASAARTPAAPAAGRASLGNVLLVLAVFIAFVAPLLKTMLSQQGWI
jgi:ankyrin repeat protein